MFLVAARQISNLIPGPPCSPSLPFYSNRSNVGCAPYNNSSAAPVPTVGWVAVPNSRSTLGIVWSCLFTLFTCIWTALHLNIPRENEGFWSKCFRKFKRMTLTMIAPEYTFWVASGQRSVATKSLKQLRKYGSWHWTTTHAFYAAMGGFVFVENESRDARRFPISIEEILQLLEDKQISLKGVKVLQQLSKEDIEDRSKANSFAKGLALVQFVWLGLQCSARAAQHLPFTPLELVTVAEAIVTIRTYIMWWNKPLDVTSTIDLHIPPTSTLASAICNPTKFRYNHYHLWGPSVRIDSVHLRIRNGFRIANDTEYNDHRMQRDDVSTDIYSVPGSSFTRSMEDAREGAVVVSAIHEPAVMTPANRQHERLSIEEQDIANAGIPLQTLSRSSRSSWIEAEGPDVNQQEEGGTPHHPTIEPDSNSHRDAEGLFSSMTYDQAQRRSNRSRSNRAASRTSSNSTIMMARRGLFGDWKGTFEVTAPFFEAGFLAVGFGALHAAAWNFDFPTLVERHLWRISSLILATSLPIFFLCWIFITAHEEKDTPAKRVVLRCFVVLFGGVYILARLYTLVECLASLRRQPVGVYETTKWTLYLPHF